MVGHRLRAVERGTEDGARTSCEALLDDATRIRLRADVAGRRLHERRARLVRGRGDRCAAGRPRARPRTGSASATTLRRGARRRAIARRARDKLHRTVVDARPSLSCSHEPSRSRRGQRCEPLPRRCCGSSAPYSEAGLKVVLTGEGADELFAGYDIFREDKIRRFWARDPASALRPLLFRRLNRYWRPIRPGAAGSSPRFYGRGLTERRRPALQPSAPVPQHGPLRPAARPGRRRTGRNRAGDRGAFPAPADGLHELRPLARRSTSRSPPS